MHLLEERDQALPEGGQAIFHMGRDGLKILARNKPGFLQFGQLSRQSAMGDAPKIALQLVKSAAALRKPEDDQ